FVFAAKNNQDSARECVDRFERGVDVSGFRIVVVADAIELGDELEAVFNSLKRANSFLDFARTSPREARCSDGSKNVFKIVGAGDRNFRLLENYFFFAVMAEEYFL